MGRYLENLARDLHQFYEMEEQVTLQVRNVEVALGVNEAIPFALIAHELLSNAFEHAFPDGLRGAVRLSLTHGGPNPGDSTLEVQDDGIGMPEDVRIETSDTLGFDIVRLLSAQLAATVIVKPVEKGSCFRVSFPARKDDC